MIRLKQAVIVEGKYDKIKLSGFLDALIIETDGFGIFKNKEKRELIRLLAKETGIIVMTDSDSAGAVIRSHIKNFVKEGEISFVYLPQIKGKERRKTAPGAQGILGVEGLSEKVITDALYRNGITGEQNVCNQKPLTKADLYALGLSGCNKSRQNRKLIMQKMLLPDCLSANSFLEYINRTGKAEQVEGLCKEWLQDTDKR